MEWKNSEVLKLVCPVSIGNGQGFYVELFLIGALNRLQRWLRKRALWAKTFRGLYVRNAVWAFGGKSYVTNIV